MNGEASIDSIPFDTFSVILSYLHHSTDDLNTVGLVSRRWRESLLYTFARLTLRPNNPCLRPSSTYYDFPSGRCPLLQGLRELTLEYQWRDLSGRRGDRKCRYYRRGEFVALARSLSDVLQTLRINSFNDRPQRCEWEVFRDFVRTFSQGSIQAVLRGVRELVWIGRNDESTSVALSSQDLEDVGLVFPSVRKVDQGVLIERLFGSGLWRESLTTLYYDFDRRPPFVQNEKWLELRHQWPRLRFIKFTATFDPFGNLKRRTKSLRAALQGIATSRMPKLEQLQLSLRLEDFTSFDLVESLGTVANVECLYLSMEQNDEKCRWERLPEFVDPDSIGKVRYWTGWNLSNHLLDPYGVSESREIEKLASRVPSLVVNCIKSFDYSKLEKTEEVCRGHAAAILSSRNGPVSLRIREDRLFRIPQAFSYLGSSADVVGAGIMVDGDDLFLRVAIAKGFGLQRDISLDSVQFEMKTPPVSMARNSPVLLIRDPFFNVATLIAQDLIALRPFSSVTIIQMICPPTYYSRRGKLTSQDFVQAWHTPTRRVLLDILRQDGFVEHPMSVDLRCRLLKQYRIYGSDCESPPIEKLTICFHFVRNEDGEENLFESRPRSSYYFQLFESFKNQATSFLLKGDLEEARRRYQLILDCLPYVPSVRFTTAEAGGTRTAILMNMMLCHLKNHDFRQCLQVSARICRDQKEWLTPAQACKLYFRTGIANEHLRQFPRALMCYEAALKSQPSSVAVSSRLAKLRKRFSGECEEQGEE